jgi:hypothetical protein
MTRSPRPAGVTPSIDPADYLAFCDAARRFAALRPWTTMPEQPVAVIFPGEPVPHFAITLGAGGEYGGMGLLRGLQSLTWLSVAQAGADCDGDVREELDEVAFSMGPASELAPWDRAQRRAAGMRAIRGEAVASVMVKRPGLLASVPTTIEVRRLTLTTDAFAAAYAAGEIGAMDAASGSMWTLIIPEHAGPTRVESREFHAPRWIEAPPVAAPESLEVARRTKRRLVAATGTLPATIVGDDRVLRVLLLGDRATGQIVGTKVVSGVAPADAAQAFWELLGQVTARGLPAHVTIASRRLFETVATGLAALGVKVAYDPAYPGVSEVLDQLIGFFAAGPQRRPRLRT